MNDTKTVIKTVIKQGDYEWVAPIKCKCCGNWFGHYEDGRCIECAAHQRELREALQRALPLLEEYGPLYGYMKDGDSIRAEELAEDIKRLLGEESET